MQITFNLPHVFGPESNQAMNSEVLELLEETLIGMNLAVLRLAKRLKYPLPPLYRAGVRYGRTTLWEPIPALYGRKFGDCKSLAAARIAELRFQGIPAKAVHRWDPQPDGSYNYHILVQTRKGWEDPSRELGMGQNENSLLIPEERIKL